MNCPKCDEELGRNNIIIAEVGEDFIDIEIICDKCDKEFFARIKQEDLIEEE